MIIQRLASKRLSVEFKEIATDDSVKVLSIPEPSYQLTEYEFLKAVIRETNLPLNQWTQQERILAVAHYLHSKNKGEVFIGGEFSIEHYADFNRDYPDKLRPNRVIADDQWYVIPLLGALVDCIERIQFDFDSPRDLVWQSGLLAAQLRNKQDSDPDLNNPDDWMRARIQVFLKYPESVAHELVDFLEVANERLWHFFRLDLSSLGDGVVVMPLMGIEGKGAAVNAPPARFRAYYCLDRRTTERYKKTH